jgi:beta-1,4-N-acetylglucosaminyltransferase
VNEAPAGSEKGGVLLVASSGGHLLQLLQLRDVWRPEERHWVTFDRPDAQSLLAGESVTHACHPTNRNLPNLLRNLVLAFRLVREQRPRAIVSTGAGVAVPFAVAGRLHGARVVYVESLTRVDKPSLTGRLIHPLAHDFFVQWPELLPSFGKADHEGTVFDLS